MAAAARIYQLRIALPYIAPPIWRRLEVPGAMTFYDLHDAIQTAMGWEDCHLWMFHVEKTEVSPAALGNKNSLFWSRESKAGALRKALK